VITQRGLQRLADLLHRCIRCVVPVIMAQLDCAACQAIHPLATLRGELPEFIAGHSLLGVLKSRTELEERIEIVWIVAREHIDQPGAASWPPELADLVCEPAVLRLFRLSDQLLPSPYEVIGRGGIELVGSGVEVHKRSFC
jgi:hypothetical protein